MWPARQNLSSGGDKNSWAEFPGTEMIKSEHEPQISDEGEDIVNPARMENLQLQGRNRLQNPKSRPKYVRNESEEVKERRKKQQRERARVRRSQMSEEEKALMRQKDRERERGRRKKAKAQMTEEERVIKNQKIREHRIMAYAQLSQEEKEIHQQKNRERERRRRALARSQEDRLIKNRLSYRERRIIATTQLATVCGHTHSVDVDSCSQGDQNNLNPTLPRETETCHQMHRRAMNERQARKKERDWDGYMKKIGCQRIVAAIDKALVTDEEKTMKVALINWRKQRRQQQEKGDEMREEELPSPEVEEEWAWKEYFCVQLKLDFRTQRNLLCEEALEIELGPTVPFTESPLSSEHWSGISNCSAEISGGGMTSEQEAVRNRWKGVVNNDNDNEDCAVTSVQRNSFPGQIKIEPEEYNRDEGQGHEDDVADWIAHIVTEDQDGESVPLPADASAEQRQDRELHFSNLSTTEYILGQRKAEFIAARQHWITSNPEESDKRAQLDKDRDAMKERIKVNKFVEVEIVRQQLIHQRDCYSQETEASRESRITKLYKSIDSYVNRVRQTKEKIQKNIVLSKEEMKEIAANAARLRIRMERAEYELHLLLIAAVGLSTSGYRRFKPSSRSYSSQWSRTLPDKEIVTISVQDFEAALREEVNVESIVHWSKHKEVNKFKKTRIEVSCYRELLEEFLTTRRRIIRNPSVEPQPTRESQTAANEMDNTQVNNSASLYEWVSPIPESKSLQDIQRFKDFVTKYGTIVKEHLTSKAFYGTNKCTQHFKNHPPDKIKELASKYNFYVRKRYVKRKYGVVLNPGEYFDKKTMSSVKKPPRAQYGAKSKRKGKCGVASSATVSGEGQANLDNESSTPRHFTRHSTQIAKKKIIQNNQHPSSANKQKPASTQITVAELTPNDSNGMDYSNSSNTNDFADAGATSAHQNISSDEDDGWVPLGSYEMDSVIRNDILNLPNTSANQHQINQNFNSSLPHPIPNLAFQQFPYCRMNLRSGGHYITPSQFSQIQYHHHWGQMPLQPVDEMSINQVNKNANPQIQWNHSHNQQTIQNISPPLSYSLQLVSNSLTNPVPHQESYANHSESQSPSSSRTVSNPPANYDMPNLQPHMQPAIRQHEIDNDSCPGSVVSSRSADLGNDSNTESSSSSSPSPPKKKRGRPIGWRKSSKSSPVTASSCSKSFLRRTTRCPGGQRRDIWKNFKRNKFYGLPTVSRPRIRTETVPEESTFQRDPLQLRDYSDIEHLIFPKKCTQCKEVLKDADAMKEHLDTTHSKQTEPNELAKGESIENAHNDSDVIKGQPKLIKPSKTKNAQMPCTICYRSFELKTLLRHLLTVHYDIVVYAKQISCPFSAGTDVHCANTFFEKEVLRQHLYSSHVKEMDSSWLMEVSTVRAIAEKDKYYCAYCCGQSYPTYHDLKTHCKDTHDKDRVCCVYCGIYAKKEDFLMDHTRLFHPEKPVRSLPIPHVEIEERDLFRCVECESEFSSQSFLDDHKSQGHALVCDKTSTPIIQRFACPACNTELPTEKRTEEHFKKCKFRSYECFWCKRQWVSEAAVRSHIADVHPTEPPVPKEHKESYMRNNYKCELCTRSFSYLNGLRMHSIIEHQLFKYFQEKQILVDIPQEVDSMIESQNESRSNTSTTATEGNTAQLSEEVKMSCPVCKSSANIHRVHIQYDQLMKRYCVPCDRLLSRPIVLVNHNEVAHGIVAKEEGRKTLVEKSGRTLGTCSDDFDANTRVTCSCGRSFAPETFHHGHSFVSKHSSAKILQQEDYDKLSAITTLPSSNSGGEITIYSCRVCLKNFSTLQFLQAHISKAHAEDAFTRVLCKICNTTFSSKMQLQKHEKFVHTDAGMTRFRCPFCEQLFIRKDKIKLHCRKIHPDLNYTPSAVKTVSLDTEEVNANCNYKCKICSRAFTTESWLRSHMTTKHFPPHLSSFCAICGLQTENLHGKTGHMMNHHPEVAVSHKKEKGVRQHKPDHKRINLSQIVGIIQEIYEKTGKTHTSLWSTNHNKKSFGSASKLRSGKKGRQSSTSEEDEDEEEEEVTSDAETEDEVNSNTEEEGEKEAPTKSSRKKSAPSIPEQNFTTTKPKSFLKTKIKPTKTVEPRRTSARGRPLRRKSLKATDYVYSETNSEEEDEMDDTVKKSVRIKSTSNTRTAKTVEPGKPRSRGRPIGRKTLKVTDHVYLESNSEEDEMDDAVKKSKRTKSTSNIRALKTVRHPHTDTGSECEDVYSDSDFTPKKFTSGSSIKNLTSRQRSLRNLPKRTSTSNRTSSAQSSINTNSVPVIDESRKLVLRLERCDHIMKRLKTEANSNSKRVPKITNELATRRKVAQNIISHELNSVEEVVVKDEIDEDGSPMEDINNLNMDILSHSPSNWQYVDMQRKAGEDFHPPEDDPFSEL